MYCGCIYFLVHLSTVIWVNYLLLFYATQSLILIISFSCLFYQIGHIPITIFSQMLKHFVFFFFETFCLTYHIKKKKSFGTFLPEVSVLLFHSRLVILQAFCIAVMLGFATMLVFLCSMSTCCILSFPLQLEHILKQLSQEDFEKGKTYFSSSLIDSSARYKILGWK